MSHTIRAEPSRAMKASSPSDVELRLGREAVMAVKMGYTDEVRIYTNGDGEVCILEVGHGQTRVAS